jgi:hypothetical protein
LNLIGDFDFGSYFDFSLGFYFEPYFGSGCFVVGCCLDFGCFGSDFDFDCDWGFYSDFDFDFGFGFDFDFDFGFDFDFDLGSSLDICCDLFDLWKDSQKISFASFSEAIDFDFDFSRDPHNI